MTATARLYINGKFYAGALNGVHRVADRLIRELDAALSRLPPNERPRATLLIPRRRRWQPQLSCIELAEQPRGHSQLWEQLILPFVARDGVLLNLCNLAPVLHPAKALMIHDAQFLFPDNSYPLRLRLGYRLLTPLMARTSAALFTVSAYSRQMLGLLGVAPAERFAVLHNGVDHMFEASADPAVLGRLQLVRHGYVIHVASHKRYKNTRVLFDAFSDPALRDLSLVLVGPDRATLSAHGLVPPPAAVFAGPVSDGELRALYEHALCLAMPSTTEGFGLPPLEAMACGCPAVITPVGAMPEVCRDSVLYADVGDAGSWVEAFLALAGDARLREAKASEGRQRAERFTWAGTGQALCARLLAMLHRPQIERSAVGPIKAAAKAH